MAQADWTDFTSSALGSADVSRGVSSAFTLAKVPDAGTFCYAFRSNVSTSGVAGKYCNVLHFAPFTGSRKGGSMRCLMKRYSSGANYAPMIGVIKGTNPLTSEGYFLGLTAASSYQIALKKGAPASGLSASDSTTLRSSNVAYTDVGDSAAVWFHLRLDVLVNPHGEVVLNVYQNDVQTNGLGAGEVWLPIDGMDQFIDDPAGVFSGSVPHLDGFYGFYGMYTTAAGSTALFDHIEVWRQTAP